MHRWCAVVLTLAALRPAFALDPRKSLTQYSRTVWTQEQGLPQDGVQAIAQTSDGYLWLGTDEGLARFDGYEFVNFSSHGDGLPSNSITALATGTDGSLWIGTRSGLTRYHENKFRTYTQKDGLPDDSVSALLVDHTGMLWIVAGNNVSRFDGSRFTNFLREKDLPMTSARALTEDSAHAIYVAGNNQVARFDNGRFVSVFEPGALRSDFPGNVGVDHAGNIWALGVRGLIRRSSSGEVRRFGAREGLPESFGLTAFREDRDGNLWIGTSRGVARLEGSGFRTRTANPAGEPESVRCLFEDSEGNLWVGSSGGLTRYRDDVFAAYGASEGLESDEPSTVYQDHSGRVWVGFLDGGLAAFSGPTPQTYTTQPPMPKTRVYSFRETPRGEMLVATRSGLMRIRDHRLTAFIPPDPQGRKSVYDALEDDDGHIWLALPNGLAELNGSEFRTVISSGPLLLESSIITLAKGQDGSLWAGSIRKGLWRLHGADQHLYTTADGLGSNQVRSLYVDSEGTLWIGTLGGGLAAFRDGKFTGYGVNEGLLSENVSRITDDGDSLWLSTTRGICRVSKQQLRELAAGRIAKLHPVNYGMADGLRSAQYSLDIAAGGGVRFQDNLWFVTTRGLAVYQAGTARKTGPQPAVHLVGLSSDGHELNWAPGSTVRIPPGSGRLEIHYTAIHLHAPDEVQYSYKLEGLDSDWVQAGNRRIANYNSLKQGSHRFLVRAEIPGGAASEASFDFDLLPHFYQTVWFQLLIVAAFAGMAYLIYRLRVQQVHSRFAAVLEERARLAREVHDTLAQGFVGIASQLDVVDMRLPKDAEGARDSLDLARKMAQHSLTEARRSVMDLRAAALNDQDLAGALQSAARSWTAGSGVDLSVDVSGETSNLPEEVAHHVLRIAQEAVANVVKHAGARTIAMKLHVGAQKLNLRVSDDGKGFERDGAFASSNGHFGLIGMRERAERLGGELQVESRPGHGTELEVTVPL